MRRVYTATLVAGRAIGPILGLAVVLAAATPRCVHAQAAVRHTVDSDGHPLAVWEKRAADPAAVVLLLHGRTWSTLPDFDLQVPGEELSLMDGLVERGFVTYGWTSEGTAPPLGMTPAGSRRTGQ